MQGSGQPGLVDLLIESDEYYTVVEFKNIPIEFLDLNGNSHTDKAEQLVAMTLPQILKLAIKSKFRAGTIKKWLEKDIYQQLRSYVTGATVRSGGADKIFRAYAVVIIGSRHILIREMNRSGEWTGEGQLINEMRGRR
jgi:hypothetical protein